MTISKIAIERCGHYSSCRDCLQARNPYCGWCSLQKSCTLKGECRDHKTSSSSRWLSLDTQQCIDFQSIKPESLPITSTDKTYPLVGSVGCAVMLLWLRCLAKGPLTRQELRNDRTDTQTPQIKQSFK
ncbi:unnamed protein product [Medioppia subpectinata]|uniref:PSI domain-containing protein n=1 Tax=Medioppia subpectinata TaxID=1979941 RepID=A0A7R9Q8R4_9ACAR|nr:unnamed protein product [Medioppia subpectinata]CAG2116142.1 unnamed protein product [Medioppia subpectinata]